MQQHAEDSVGTIKALFESTYAKAVWHRPSLIVFDDLDKVVGAELEVQLLHHLHRTQINSDNLPSISTQIHSVHAKSLHFSSTSSHRTINWLIRLRVWLWSLLLRLTQRFTQCLRRRIYFRWLWD